MWRKDEKLADPGPLENSIAERGESDNRKCSPKQVAKKASDDLLTQ